MQIDLMDRSKYFRAMVILIKRDKIFLKDGIKIAFADKNLHQKEYNWLQKVARANHISDEWLLGQLHDFLNDPQKKKSKTLEIEKYYQKYQEISKSKQEK